MYFDTASLCSLQQQQFWKKKTLSHPRLIFCFTGKAPNWFNIWLLWRSHDDKWMKLLQNNNIQKELYILPICINVALGRVEHFLWKGHWNSSFSTVLADQLPKALALYKNIIWDLSPVRYLCCMSWPLSPIFLSLCTVNCIMEQKCHKNGL